jgi:hypothetical protein
MTGWDRASERRVDVISGAAMFVRRAAMDEVGLLDEAFFFYGEETDWCHRFRARGVGARLRADPGDHPFRQRLGRPAQPPPRRADDGGDDAPPPQAWRSCAGLACFAILATHNASRAVFWAVLSLPAGPARRARARHFAAVVADLPRPGPRPPREACEMKVLLLAPNVDGTDVGEALMAFKWAEALSPLVDLTVLTFQRPGRPDVAAQLPGARVVTWPEPAWAMAHERLNAMLKPAWPVFAGRCAAGSARRWPAGSASTSRTS